jgi:benzoyl-CoA reductase/2-hydroxyglutaryl-CoA dehydratase subunit BcrC/BadD/HgdB
MEAMDQLSQLLNERLVELPGLKEQGYKIIGCFGNDFIPQELVYASGAIPVGWIKGGEHEAVMASIPHIVRFTDTFCRAQIGYHVLQKKIQYRTPDLVVISITDRNVAAIADYLEMFTSRRHFKLGIPHTKNEKALVYYQDGLNLLKQELEVLTGRQVGLTALRDEIKYGNRIRKLLKEISDMRKSPYPPISGKDFLRINHATWTLDRKVMIQFLGSLRDQLEHNAPLKKKGARILLTGSSLAEGDDRVIGILEERGTQVVVEEFCEGMKKYEFQVDETGDLMEGLAKGYFQERLPDAFFRPGMRERAEYLLGLAREFQVDGLVWYSLMYRDAYDLESWFFREFLKRKQGPPLLVVHSNYDPAETEQLQTRIETFVSMIRKE